MVIVGLEPEGRPSFMLHFESHSPYFVKLWAVCGSILSWAREQQPQCVCEKHTLAKLGASQSPECREGSQAREGAPPSGVWVNS